MGNQLHRVVVVGGGAGGVELATRLGNGLGKRGRAHITLIDKNRTHIWKPKLHEIAAGSMDIDNHSVDYLAQAHWHGFQFRLGEMIGIDRQRKTVHVGPYRDEHGLAITPESHIPYDTLVLSIGSVSNDFGTPGVGEYALSLESQKDAKNFHIRILNACLRAQSQNEPLRPGQLHVAIIGAGATGVELAAELHRTTREMVSYGLDRLDPDKDIRVSIIEAAPQILPALPLRISEATHRLLAKLNINVSTRARVAKVSPVGVHLEDGRVMEAEIVVWAAGVKAPDFLNGIAGLETNRLNQLLVKDTLETTRDPDIFAMGDCAACLWHESADGKKTWVPPRAQAAHQQASHLFGQIKRRLKGQRLVPYTYRDFGSLVSLGRYSTVGSMMGGLIGGNMMIEGAFAKVMYLSLYKMHELALHGWVKVGLDTFARLITRRTEPHVKLH